MFQNLNKKSVIYFGVAVLIALSATILALYFLQESKEMPPIRTEPSPKILTPEEIQEALAKEAEPSEIKPLTQKQINEALNKKASSKEGVKPLAPEEIQKGLQAE